MRGPARGAFCGAARLHLVKLFICANYFSKFWISRLSNLGEIWMKESKYHNIIDDRPHSLFVEIIQKLQKILKKARSFRGTRGQTPYPILYLEMERGQTPYPIFISEEWLRDQTGAKPLSDKSISREKEPDQLFLQPSTTIIGIQISLLSNLC